MFAVLSTGNKQYKVREGSIIKTERIIGEVGESVSLDVVLAFDDDGKIYTNIKSVSGVILEQKRDKKIIVFKKRRRKDYKSKNGHRQDVTVLRIESVSA